MIPDLPDQHHHLPYTHELSLTSTDDGLELSFPHDMPNTQTTLLPAFDPSDDSATTPTHPTLLRPLHPMSILPDTTLTYTEPKTTPSDSSQLLTALHYLTPTTAATPSAAPPTTEHYSHPADLHHQHKSYELSHSHALPQIKQHQPHLPKVQRTDAPMLNHIFDTIGAANKHHHHDHRWDKCQNIDFK